MSFLFEMSLFRRRYLYMHRSPTECGDGCVALHGSAFLCVVSRRADHSETILERQESVSHRGTDHHSMFPLFVLCFLFLFFRMWSQDQSKVMHPFFFFKKPDECDHSYLQLSGSHFENELHHGADSETSCTGGVDLVPNGVTVHLETQNTFLR